MNRISTLTCLCLCIHTSVFSQLPQDAQWSAYTNMRQINDILVAGDDIWMASSGGALHYDKANRVYHRFTSLDGLAGNRLLSVAMDRAGDLWFGTAHQGLCRLRRGATRFDPPFIEFRDREIHAILAHQDRLYVGTDRGISVFLLDTEEVELSYRRLGNLPFDSPVNTMLVHNDTLFAGARKGVAWADLAKLNLRDPDNWRSMPRSGAVHDMVVADNVVLATSKHGVFSFEPAQDLFFLEFEESEVRALGSLDGRALAATEGGRIVQRRQDGTWRRVGATSILGANAISELNGSAWLATNSGLRVVRAGEPPPSGEPASSRFFDIIRVEDELWSTSVADDLQATASAGISRLVDGGWTVFDKSTGMLSDQLVALETDRDGVLWVGSWGDGIAVQQGSGWVTIDESNSSLQGIGSKFDFVATSDIARDPQGNMWIVTVAVGVAVLDGFPENEGFLFDQVEMGQSGRLDLYRIEFAAQGHKWLASRTDGLVILDDGDTPFIGGDDRFVVINQSVEPRLSSNRAFDVAEEEDGTLWVATDNGLNSIRSRYDRDSGGLDVDDWRVYSTLDGLASDEINTLEIENDHVWVGTNRGLSLIEDGEVVLTLTAANSGLISNTVTGLYFDAESNDLWIGTLEGLSRLHLGTDMPMNVEVATEHTVFPNPFVADGHGRLTLTGLPPDAHVRIYSSSGELVSSLSADPAHDRILWTGQNDRGTLVGSGIFFYVVESPTVGPIRGRFAVVNTGQ